MDEACPAPRPDDPLVRSLMGVVDCNVHGLVHAAYVGLLQPGGVVSGLLTAFLTIFVALIGYGLLLGRTQLRVSDFALNAVKVGAVLALATQWDTYQTLVYDFLFSAPQHLGRLIASAVHPTSPLLQGDVFDGLQTAFDLLSTFGAGYAAHAQPAASPMLGGAGFSAVLVTAAGAILLLSTLGVLLTTKIVLGLLLAVGPLFIALFLFDSTRGIFEGWLRSSLAFAFAPLAVTIILAVALTMLEPSLQQMDELQKAHIYTPGPAFSVMILVLVTAGVSLGALIAGAVIALGFHLPRRSPGAAGAIASPAAADAPVIVDARLSRAARVAAGVVALDRRDAGASLDGSRLADRRNAAAPVGERTLQDAPEPVRLGQSSQPRRAAGPRPIRPNARTAR